MTAAEQQASQGNPESNPNVNPQLTGRTDVGGFVGNAEGQQTGVATGTPQSPATTVDNQPVMENQQPQTPQAAQAAAEQDRQRLQQQIPSHPAVDHFKNFWEGMVPSTLRPRLGADGKPTGEIDVIHPKKGTIAAGILAGALSAMFAKSSSSGDYRKDLSSNLAAGADAVKEQQYKKRFNELNMSQEQQQYAYNTTKLQLDGYKQGFDAYNIGEAAQRPLAEAGGAIQDSLLESGVGMSQDPDLQHLSNDQAMALVNNKNNKYHVTRDMLVADRDLHDVTDKDGNPVYIPGTKLPRRENTWSVVDPMAMTKVTAELQKMFPDQLAGVERAPVRTLIKLAQTRQYQVSARAVIEDMVNRTNEAFHSGKGDKNKVSIDFDQFLKDNPQMRKMLPALAGKFGHNMNEAFKELRAAGDTTSLEKALGYDESKWSDYYDQRKKEAERENDPMKRDANPKDIQNFAADMKKEFPNFPDAAVADFQRRLGDDPSQGNYNRVFDQARTMYHQQGLDQPGRIKYEPQYDQLDASGINVGQLEHIKQGGDADFALIQAIGEGRETLAAGQTRSKDGIALASKVNLVYPHFVAGQSENYVKTRQDFLTGRTGQGIGAMNVALGHAAKMYKQVSGWATVPGVKDIRALMGKQDVADLKYAQQQLSTELGRAYAGGVITQTEHDDQEKLLNSMSPYKLKANLHSVVDFLESKINYQRTQWENAIPDYMRDQQKLTLLSPDAASAIQMITGRKVDPMVYGQGRRVREGQAQGQSQPQQERPVSVNGKVIGYTMDGKTLSRKVQ